MSSPSSSQRMGLWSLTALVAGNMIGSGVFGLPASLAQYGSIALVAWAITAVGALMLALAFCKLSHLIPKSGGPYAYCRAAFGDFMGFVVAFNYWLAIWIGNAGIAVAFTGYLTKVPGFSFLEQPEWGCLCSMALVWWITLINLLGVRQAAALQLITTVLKFVPLLCVSLFGLWYIKPEHLALFNVSHLSNAQALTGAAALTMWSFVGLESATVPADSVIQPEKNIPRATVIGTLLAALVYLTGGMVVMGVVPNAALQVSSAPFAEAAHAIFGSIGEKIILFAALISTLGALNGWILLQGQVPMAVAEDGLFPKIFSKRSQNGTPVYGLVISSLLMTVVLYLTSSSQLNKQFELIILLATLASLIVYFLSALSCLILMNQQKGPSSKLWLSICLLGLLYAFWTFSGAGKDTVFYGSLLFFGGMPLYAWVHRQQQLEKQ